MTIIKLDIKDCSECPKVLVNRTQNAGFAFDYHCTLNKNKMVMGYVEYSNDYNPVPDWCPLREK